MRKIKNVIGSLAGILLSANSVLAVESGSTATGMTSHLGPAAGMMSDIITWIFWCAILSVPLCLFILMISGNIAYASNKTSDALNAKKGKNAVIIETFIVVLALVIFFSYLVPKMQGVLGIA